MRADELARLRTLWMQRRRHVGRVAATIRRNWGIVTSIEHMSVSLSVRELSDLNDKKEVLVHQTRMLRWVEYSLWMDRKWLKAQVADPDVDAGGGAGGADPVHVLRPRRRRKINPG